MSSISTSFRDVMLFIDGGYLRAVLRPLGCGIADIDFANLADNLLRATVTNIRIRGELIRVFYYDAAVTADVDPDEHRKRDSDFEIIRRWDHVQVRLGRLIKGHDGWRQKGVDVLLAIDMITKAYEQQYEIAILLAGDDDFVDVVNAVKDEGRRVYGAFETKSASKRLIDTFDKRIPLSPEDIPRIRPPAGTR